MKKRFSGIELLRIFAMFLIVASHLSQRGNWSWLGGMEGYSLKQLLMDWVICFGQVGVAIFFAITGYFVFNSKGYNWRRIFTIWRPTIFYSLTFLILARVLRVSGSDFTWPLGSEFARSIFPVSLNAYWFVSSYIVLHLLLPYIKTLLDNLEYKEIRKLIIVAACVSIVPNFISYITTGVASVVFSIPSAVFYAIVGYSVHRFEGRLKAVPSWKLMSVSIIGFIMYLVLSLLIRLAASRLGYVNLNNNILIDTLCLPCMLSSIPLVVVFSRMRFVNAFINYVSSLTFGVYLIHSNVFFVSYLWRQNDYLMTFNASHYHFLGFCFYFVGSVVLIFGFSSIVEALRKIIVLFSVRLIRKSNK